VLLMTLADHRSGSGAGRDVAAGDVLRAAGELFDGSEPVVAVGPDGVRFLRRDVHGCYVSAELRPPVAEALDLMPHPEGGWFRETWKAPFRCEPPGHGGERATATGIYFLLGPGEESVWHVVRSDELWLWHRGGPLELVLAGDGDTPGPAVTTTLVGPAVEEGQVPQALVPAGVWQSARPAGDREVLVSCVVSPGFDFADFRAL
jgi:predicted cupin superfamily sugar epimerase